MPEFRDLPLFRWGEELRRDREGRRARRSRVAMTLAGLVVAAALVGTLLWPPRPALVWNRSASAPTGFYLVSSASGLEPGDMVLAWAPPAPRRLAAERFYLPANVPLVKRVAAASGDRVCAIGEALFVNGAPVARRRLQDGAGRPLPWWTGCKRLEGRELLLLMPAADSFDGRYFGTTDKSDVIGRARLVWAA